MLLHLYSVLALGHHLHATAKYYLTPITLLITTLAHVFVQFASG